MQTGGGMQILADFVAVIHILYFVFIVLGFFGIIIGAFRHWRWIRNSWFRILHMAAVYIVLGEDVIRVACPLTVAESELQKASGQPVSGAGHVINELLFHVIYGTVLDAIYWSLGVALLVLLFLVPPNFMRRFHRHAG